MATPRRRQLEVTFKNQDGKEETVIIKDFGIETFSEGFTFSNGRLFTITFKTSTMLKISRWKRIVTFIKNLFKRK